MGTVLAGLRILADLRLRRIWVGVSQKQLMLAARIHRRCKRCKLVSDGYAFGFSGKHTGSPVCQGDSKPKRLS